MQGFKCRVICLYNEGMRYSRQTILPEIGVEGQSNLKASRILCIGAGGLGCAALPYLAAAGVGQIGIVDDDRVDVSNLQRQVLFKTDDVGGAKAELAAKALRGLNPEIQVKAYPTRLTAENAVQLFTDYDIILDGSDNFPTKFLINDAAVKLNKPWIYAAVLGFEAQVSVFVPGHGPCYRCLYAKPPESAIPNCAEAGVLGAFVGVVGTMQAVEAVKLASKSTLLTAITGRLLTLDARDWQWREFTVKRNSSCPVCSNPEEVRLVMSDNACATTAPGPAVPEITADEAGKLENAVFLDVREPHEWDEGHVPDALHIPVGTLLTQNAPEVPRDKELVVYCRGGTRSKKALAYLQTLGFTNGKNMIGGFISWEKTNPERVT
jgi:molybdopterin/thiamine biosynthesis adenylyltransferase/rhodanese-related sulfurtransferase